jgi:oligopeptide/dipeptide ABC transporter ATP-binding protein
MIDPETDNGRTLLRVANLYAWNTQRGPRRQILEDISFSVGRGELVVLLGESGSGKTTLARAITKLLPEKSGIELSGTVSFAGKPLDDDGLLSSVHRQHIRYIFQHPSRSLNPTARIKTQLRNAANGRKLTEEDLLRILEEVGLPTTGDILNCYPHQLSVGMAQRVAIAMAIMPGPDLLIADEPTSALDTPLRIQLLDLLKSIQKNHGMAMLLVTHNLEVAREYADRIIVLYSGRIIESSVFHDFFENPLHPYSRLMMASLRRIGERFLPETLMNTSQETIGSPHHGCRFSPRCSLVREQCLTREPELETVDDRRMVRCFFWK